MFECKVSYVYEVLDGMVSRSDTCEIGLTQKGAYETPSTSPIIIDIYANICHSGNNDVDDEGFREDNYVLFKA